jgi:import inner membrane translocase subunit TIM16
LFATLPSPAIYCALIKQNTQQKQQFEKYFAANSVEKGGSFYVQSKIYRAKEMLDQYIKEKKLEDKDARDKETQSKPKN